MEVLNAVNLVSCIHSERYPVKALSTHYTGEAVWMVRLASGSQDLGVVERETKYKKVFKIYRFTQYTDMDTLTIR